jgi:hypothetical protein
MAPNLSDSRIDESMTQTGGCRTALCASLIYDSSLEHRRALCGVHEHGQRGALAERKAGASA